MPVMMSATLRAIALSGCIFGMLVGAGAVNGQEWISPQVSLRDVQPGSRELAVGDGFIYLLDRSTGQVRFREAGSLTWQTSNVTGARHLVHYDGHLYAAGDQLDSLGRFNVVGTELVPDPAYSPPTFSGSIAADTQVSDWAASADEGIYALAPGLQAVLLWPEGAADWAIHSESTELSRADLMASGAGAVYAGRRGDGHLLQITASGSLQRIGESLAGYHGLLAAEALAVDALQGRVVVADRARQNVLLFSPDGALEQLLSDSATTPAPLAVTVDDEGAIHVVDEDRQVLFRWPRRAEGQWRGSSGDPYIAHMEGDDGTEPSTPPSSFRSPQIIVRQQPLGWLDLDGDHLPHIDPVLAGRENFLYIILKNRVDEPSFGGFIGAWWSARDAQYRFPRDWSQRGFKATQFATSPQRPYAFIDTGEIGGLAVRMYGPIGWTPEETMAGDCSEEYYVLAKYMNRYDVDTPIDENVVGAIFASNDVAERQVEIARPDCVPRLDRYEYNDYPETAVVIEEGWDFKGNRCPHALIRGSGERYPDAICEDVFEDEQPPSLVPSLAAEQIWTMTVPDLSLHSREDEDFYQLPLPVLSDPRWGLADINPASVQMRGRLQPDYRPTVMPECGSVQRNAFAPGNRDSTVYVNVSTELVISARAVANATTGEAAVLTSESLSIPGQPPGPPSLSVSISCPRQAHGMDQVPIALEHFVRSGVIDPLRPLEDSGGYELEISYIATARRGFPEWADGENGGQGVRPTPCLPIQIGPGIGVGGLGIQGAMAGNLGRFRGNLMSCLSIPGLLNPGMRLPHPGLPGLAPCIADGPGCRELSYFDIGDAVRGKVIRLFADRLLQVAVLNLQGRTVAKAHSLPIMQNFQDQTAQQGKLSETGENQLDLSNLVPGPYFLLIEGPPGDLLMVPESSPGKGR